MRTNMQDFSRIYGAILLIVGTSIGAGMLGLPITTGLNGFLPSISVFLICGTLMLWSAFLMVEVICVFKENTNLISMAKQTIGEKSTIFVWIVFLGLFYSLLAAYLSASGNLFLDVFDIISSNHNLNNIAPMLIIFMCSPFLLFGIKYIDSMNQVTFSILVLSYLLLILLLFKHIDIGYLQTMRGGFFMNSLSITILSFAFHPILPTISEYLKYNIKDISATIIVGSAIIFIIYVLWEMMLLGVVPIVGDVSISKAYVNETTFSALLFPILDSKWISIAMWIFSFFSILTSFIGVSQASIDFFIDGLRLQKNMRGIFQATLLTYLPPILFSYRFKQSFVIILDYAGVFLILLSGILPIIMAYIIRYRMNRRLTYLLLSNKYVLSIGFFIYSNIIVFIIAKNLGYINIVT